MPTMIEKVALALMHHCRNIGAPYQIQNIDSKGFAKAAIKAMKEPTEEMYDAGHNAKCDVIEVYKAMIDTALENE